MIDPSECPFANFLKRNVSKLNENDANFQDAMT